MISVPPERITAGIDRMAALFERRVREMGADTAGWGQFLDGPVEQPQVGPYGTASGLLVRGIAQREQDELATKAQRQVRLWWDARAGTHRKVFAQTTRLAFLHLALRLSGLPADECRTGMTEMLMQRQLPGGLWGDYWDSPAVLDNSPRLFPSAVALLSLRLMNPSGPTPELSRAAERLEQRLIGNVRLSSFYIASAGAAILATQGGIGKKAGRRLVELSRRGLPDLAELGVYFYEYQYDRNGSPVSDRDYFIVPTAFMAAIAGSLPGAPASLRLRAESIARLVVANLEENDGAFKPSPEDRLSTKNQAWAALLLRLAMIDSGKAHLKDLAMYGLFRERRDNIFTSRIMPPVAWAAAAAGNIVLAQSPLWARCVGAFSALVIGGIYPPSTVLRRSDRQRQ